MKAHEEPARPAPRALELPRRAPALVAFRFWVAVNENEKLASVLLLNRSSHGSKARSRGAQSSINDAAIEEPAGCGVEAAYCSRSPRQCTNGWFTPTLFAIAANDRRS